MSRSLEPDAPSVNADDRRSLAQRQALREWFDSPLGCSLQAQEVHRLREVLPRLYGTAAVQLGRLGRLDMLDACVAPTRILLDDAPRAGDCAVRGEPEAMPFDTRSVDLLVLPHTLDFCRDPHSVLREAERVLAPEGHMVVIGFNPFSLWGLRRLVARRPRVAPWNGRFLRLARVKDWLRLLGFELTLGSMVYYRPPLTRERSMDRLHFLDKMGDRWWPMMAASYVLVAKKRVVAMTPLRPAWSFKRVAGAAAAARTVTGRGAVVRLSERRGRVLG